MDAEDIRDFKARRREPRVAWAKVKRNLGLPT